MGSRMALRLLRAGHEVTVYNRSPAGAAPLIAAGAELAASPRDAAARCSVVISMVRDDAASRAIWLDAEVGALGGLREGSIAIESSTLSIGWVQELAGLVRQRSAEFLDAPVVGSRPQAEAGQLVYLVGGEAAALAEVRCLLSTMGSAIHAIGPAGHGAAMKLAVNAYFAIQLAALGEIFGLLRHCGLAEAEAAALLDGLPVMSPAAKAAAAAMVQRNYAPMFPIALVEKDLLYAAQAADGSGADLPLVRAAHGLFKAASARGLGGNNISGIAQLFD